MDTEGDAIARDDSGIYVTGIIHTLKDDADILTIKLSLTGQEIWHHRYHSPEHDCDRASSIFVTPHGAVFVLGETWVPDRPGNPGAWHLTLIRYSAVNGFQWTRRSLMPVDNQMQHMKAFDDGKLGYYAVGTGFVKGQHSILWTHYDGDGKRLGQNLVDSQSDTIFSSTTCTPDAMFVCGTSRKKNHDGTVCDEAVLIRIDNNGNMKWRKSLIENYTGNTVSDSIIGDGNGNILVAGSVETLDAKGVGNGRQLSLDKFTSAGVLLWQR